MTGMDRISDGRKRLIYEYFFNPQLRYTIQEAYDFIEAEAPFFDTWEEIEAFQAKVLARFPPMPPGDPGF